MAQDRWTSIDVTRLKPILSSGNTCEVPRENWLPWMQQAPQLRRFFAYALRPGEDVPSLRTSSQVVARLLTERLDEKDEEPFNYDWYGVVQSSSGSYYLSGPHKDIDFGHHLAQPVSAISIGTRS